MRAWTISVVVVALLVFAIIFYVMNWLVLNSL